MAAANNAPDPSPTVRLASSLVDLGAWVPDALVSFRERGMRAGFPAAASWWRGRRWRGILFSLLCPGMCAAVSGSFNAGGEICTGDCRFEQGWAFLGRFGRRSSDDAVLVVMFELVLVVLVVDGGARRERPAAAGAVLPALPRLLPLILPEGVYPTHRCVLPRRWILQRVGVRRCCGRLRAVSPVCEPCVSFVDLVVIFPSSGAFLHFRRSAVISLAASSDFQ